MAGGMKRRYFYLVGNKIYYFTSDQEKVPKGFISLEVKIEQ
jgi:hypothetical protein